MHAVARWTPLAKFFGMGSREGKGRKNGVKEGGAIWGKFVS